jgi:hypothetical protein
MYFVQYVVRSEKTQKETKYVLMEKRILNFTNFDQIRQLSQ